MPKPAKPPTPAPPAAAAPASPAPAATPPAQPAPTAASLDLILATDISNIVKKVKAGKPLSASERQILKARLNSQAAPAATPEASNKAPSAHIPTLLEQLEAATAQERRKANGRPRFKIDYALAERLSRLQCTHEEIAAVLGCSTDTLARDARFCGLHKKGLAIGRTSLRRHQWRAVEEQRDTTMMIWLGKQYLRQTDRQELQVQGPTNPADLTQDDIEQLSTEELRRLIGQAPPRAYIMDVSHSVTTCEDVVTAKAPKTSQPGSQGHNGNGHNGHNGSNGSNGHH